MKLHTKLAAALKTLAAQGNQIETTASAVLAVVKSAAGTNKRCDEKAFDTLVGAAYAVNGWNAKPGRPVNGSKALAAAPDTVRTYMTIVRRAIRVGLRIGRYATFTALRTALERKTQPRLVGRKGRKGAKVARGNGVQHAAIPKAVENDFVGIALETPRNPNGALFHDLAATFIKLPAGPRSELGRELSQLLHKYLPMAGVPTIVANGGTRQRAAQERKAA